MFALGNFSGSLKDALEQNKKYLTWPSRIWLGFRGTNRPDHCSLWFTDRWWFLPKAIHEISKAFVKQRLYYDAVLCLWFDTTQAEKMQKCMSRIKALPDGEVRIVRITDKQFSMMEVFFGKRREKTELALEQLQFFNLFSKNLPLFRGLSQNYCNRLRPPANHNILRAGDGWGNCNRLRPPANHNS